MAMPKEPVLLKEALDYFSDPDRCLEFLTARRWPNGVKCPTCSSREVRFISTRRIWECKNVHRRKQFSIRTGTIFEDSPISLSNWLCTVWMATVSKGGVGSYDVHRALGVTQKTAWFMLHRIRLAMNQRGG